MLVGITFKMMLKVSADVVSNDSKEKLWVRDGSTDEQVREMYTGCIEDVRPGCPALVTLPPQREIVVPPIVRDGLKVCGVPIGSSKFVAGWLEAFLEKFKAYCVNTYVFSAAFPQEAFMVLRLSTSTKAMHLARTLPPSVMASFAVQLDADVLAVLSRIVGSGEDKLPELAQKVGFLPMREGGLGVASISYSLHAA